MVVCVLASISLIGCQSFENYEVPIVADPNSPLTQEVDRLGERLAAAPESSIDRLRSIASTPESMRGFLSGSTVRTYNNLHGSQIETLLQDGRTFLWYPGNNSLVPGQWTTRSAGTRTQMCFRYGANSYNPVTNTAGGNWECGPARLYLLGAEEVVSGDPLLLSTRGLPFVLERENLSISQAMQRIGIDDVIDNKVSW
jgi:hypothetical protein